MKILTLICLIFVQPINNHQDSLATNMKIVEVDSTSNAALDSESLLAYQELLEKTNKQLSLWWNPYGIMIATLGVLFTILTIFAAIIIFLQGRAAKKILQDTLDKYTLLLNEFINEKNKELESKKNSIQKDVDKVKDELSKSTTENKKDLEDKIQSLESELSNLEKHKRSKVVTPQIINNPISGSITGFGQTKHHTCSKCGFGFEYEDNSMTQLTIRGYNDKIVECPECGNKDKVF